MWIMTVILSLFFCCAAWVMLGKKNKKLYWASTCSLSFTVITLHLEYKMVLDWLNMGDYSAMLDVMPTMFPMLTLYVILMLIGNAVPVALAKK